MQPRILNPDKALRTLRKTTLLLDLATAERACHYASQALAGVRAELRADRAATLDRLAALDADQWARVGHHPQQGAGTLLDVAINAGLHDVDHLEQIARCRADAETKRGGDGA